MISLRLALIRFLGGDLKSPDDGGLRAEIVALEARLRVLEDAQHPTKLIEWVELQEKLRRYLTRLQSVEQRIKAREKDSAESADPVTLALLRSKYPHTNGG